MKACWMLSTVEPTPTFSPSFVQGPLTSLGRLMLWEIWPADAMFPDQLRAIDTSPPYDASGFSPWLTRSWLVSLKNRASSEPGSAWAAVACNIDIAGVSRAIPSSNPIVLASSRRRLAIWSSPLSAARQPWGASDMLPVGPRLCAPGFPRDRPFRGHCVIGAGWEPLEGRGLVIPSCRRPCGGGWVVV